ncbi:DUF4864 domain-containing protein [Marinobacter zhanjiangensis]|uniref:DUF4864 domain-containing protein n=1 Tax=Marinobacter zhanjiangensis TaxID=578215 RepID=A0ABQ3AZS6_9GAMM|nr:DUF4864 domain-containing protein [Marinobacter zhanjiangensis]GGY72921.1 hypothetical protein GCM10007071_20020 [Marinobacter zhanjiangensis]
MTKTRRPILVGSILALVLVGLSAMMTVAPRADDTDAAIRDVILSQIEAFANDDELGAWVHASRGIQKKFRSPETLLHVVRLSYPAVHRAASIRFGKRIPHERFDIQVVRLKGPEGKLWDAYYRMVQREYEWKVGGVSLQPADTGI